MVPDKVLVCARAGAVAPVKTKLDRPDAVMPALMVMLYGIVIDGAQAGVAEDAIVMRPPP